MTKLEWHGRFAYLRGRRVLSVERELSGHWYLYRWSTGLDGIARFKSKERVKSKADGIDYANGLAKLWKEQKR